LGASVGSSQSATGASSPPRSPNVLPPGSRGGLRGQRPSMLVFSTPSSATHAPGTASSVGSERGQTSGESRGYSRMGGPSLPGGGVGVGGHHEEINPDVEAKVGFTASDLAMPLQAMLLHEEHMRHSRKLRPKQVKINLNSLTPSTSLATRLNRPDPSWGAGKVLKHHNPIPREQMGEDLKDGFAYVPQRSPVLMNSIHFAKEKDAQGAQLKLLQEYKKLHELQLQESNLRSKYAGANLEHGEIERAKSVAKPSLNKAISQPQLQTISSAASSQQDSKPQTRAQSGDATRPSASKAASIATVGAAEETTTFTIQLDSVATPAGSTPAISALASALSSIPVTPSVLSTGANTPTTLQQQQHHQQLHKHAVKHKKYGKPTKLEALLAESKHAAPSTVAQPEEDTLWLTPRTKSILQQIDANKDRHEEERRRREMEVQEASLPTDAM
jgi:hypothetical protein